ncbi:Bug family tripartite tricarboxylate transporter substrate binding protein [Rivibacter subsaxonicus]|uniref:Tripartite-type tricarboxylate transporter receptor subunit TctC n=1 Tax=Rivibacter subsaxonicus TaxID=457575 RepID=A0A4Q7W0L5_9BURK|nr:tripartite tricarboxylate transporter substrate binding protein [Rivibacter subsaxonicus]RZU02428.1 tripartite-type tricarboxylate transporter receptor subunit TctC [Rivibacter subsaxonicus]
MQRRPFLLHGLSALGAGLGLAAGAAHAQGSAWPQRGLRIIAAGAAGGSADIVARLLADQLGKQTGRTVIVEPKPGAAGVLAVNELSLAPRDGHALLVGVNSLVSEIPHIVRLKLDMAAEIRPLAELACGGLVMVANPALPARTLAELVAYARANPGKLNFASYTAGTLSHVMGLQLNQAAGIDLTHVGYKGSTPALQDLMGGHVPLMFDGMATSIPLIRAGRIRAFAVSTPKRSPLLPEVPTFTELGYPRLEATAWMGLWVKPELPAPVQAQIRDAALKAIAQPALRDRLGEIGFEAGQPRTPEQLGASLKADYERVGAVLRSIGFQPE